MKVIIVEGMDNTGKSTMIDRLIKYFGRTDGIDAEKQIYVKHLVKPDGETDIERATNIDITNFNLATFLINAHKENKYKYIILDRAWYSEYVYGQLYRNRPEHEVRKRIQVIEEYLNNYFSKHTDKVSFHLLIFLATEPNFYIKHEALPQRKAYASYLFSSVSYFFLLTKPFYLFIHINDTPQNGLVKLLLILA